MSSKTVVLAKSLDSSTWIEHQTDDVCAFLASEFGNRFPDSARIYHNEVSLDNDVTPSDASSIEKLQSLEGKLWVIVYPEYAAIPYILAIVLAVAAYVLTPKPTIPTLPTVTQRNENVGSPNNGLSDRANKARINGRIPDIFGTVRSTPDLIAAPYRVFENNREVEYAYMCIGRGYYDVTKVRDGDTLIKNIVGASVAVYDPYTSPNSGDDPVLQIGNKINAQVLNTKRNNAVNGQVLRPPNDAIIVGNNNIVFIYPNVIRYLTSAGTSTPFGSQFAEGDLLTITDAVQVAIDGDINFPGYISITPHFDFDLTYLPFGAGFKNGGYVTLGLSPGSTTAPAGWTVGSNVTLVQQFYKDTGDYGLYTNGYTTLVTGAVANMGGTFEIAEIKFFQSRPDSNVAMGVRFVDPVAVNANWGHDFGSYTVEPFGLDGTPAHVMSITVTADIPGFNLNGTYSIVSVTNDEITLDDPVSVNADWAVLNGNSPSTALSSTLSVTGFRWVGPFVIEEANCTQLFANFVAVNGLYEDNGTDQTALTGFVALEVTPIDEDDVPSGSPETFQLIMFGSNKLKESLGSTLKATFLSFPGGRCQVRASRLNQKDTEFEGQVVDEVRWRDIYSITPVTETDFGNVTTVHSVTYATASALAVKERQLNMQVQRKVPARVGSTDEFTDSALVATNRADAIFMAICRDRYIGNRLVDEINVDNVYDTVQAIADYFGDPSCAEFCYTFDNDNLSFEETAQIVAQAIFSLAYRRANVINLSFEKETDDSVILFNHRNKVPDTEKRSYVFGLLENNDGLQYTYVDPKDDSIITIFLPEAVPTTNPKKVESIGVRNHLQAYFQSWRAWNKMNFKRLNAQFDALQEAQLVVQNDRVLATDGTTAGTQDGEVIEVVGLELTLSQVVDLTVYDSYSIYLQHTNGTVENIAVTAGSAPNKVVLGSAPAHDLNVDIETSSRCTYVLIGEDEQQETAFLVTERTPEDGLSSTLSLVNYDSRYYANDLDFINDVIGANGYGSGGGFLGAGSGESVYTGATSSYPAPPLLGGLGSFNQSEAVSVDDTSDYQFGVGSFTIETWIYLPNTGPLVSNFPDARIIGSFSPFTGKNWQFAVVTSDIFGDDPAGHPRLATFLQCEDGISVHGISSTNVPMSTWAHVALVVDRAANQAKFYLNGVLDGTVNTTPLNAGGSGGLLTDVLHDLYILYDSWGTETTALPYFIDEMRIWDVARTESQIADNKDAEIATLPASGLAAYWKINETSGTTSEDFSGNTHPIVLNTDQDWRANYVA